MSRFVAPDLAALGDVPAVVGVDFEGIKAGRDSYLIEALAAHGITYDVSMLETDPLVIAFSEAGGYRETYWRQELNEAIRAVMSATASGGDLDHIGATFTGIERLVYENDEDDQPANSQWDAVRAKWVETDDKFRARIALAFEAFSTAGPEGAYVFHALELDGVRDITDAAVYSEEDEATYSATLHADAYTAGQRIAPFADRDNGDPVIAPEILVVVLPTLSYGVANQPLIDRVYAAITGEEVRPVGDNVRVEAAAVTNYSIVITLYYGPGADAAVLAEEAEARLWAYAADRRRIGATIQREVIGGRAAIDNGVTVVVTQPASSIDPGSKGAANCTAVTVNTVQAAGTWN